MNLHEVYVTVAKNLPNNPHIKFIKKGIDKGSKKFSLTPLEKIPDPVSLIELKRLVSQMLPKVDLPQILLEIEDKTGFTSEFCHFSQSKPRLSTLKLSICATLIGEACNIGFKPCAGNHDLLTENKLNWINRYFIRTDTLTSANAHFVAEQANIPIASLWGGGEVASADGLRFVVGNRTVNAGYNPKYFNRRRGLTWYNYMSDQYMGFNHVVVPGTIRDSIYILDGLVAHTTHLEVKEMMVDTAGASHLVFGLFWLLGYRFSPRLADLGSRTLHRFDLDADYGEIGDVATGKIDGERIIDQSDEMLRLTASIKSLKIKPSEAIRALSSKSLSPLSKAIQEVGKIEKAFYTLAIIDDPYYRRRTLTQLNRGESRHSLARMIYHGKRGKMYKYYREGQEDQLGALGLVLNAVVLWNTIYIQRALDELVARGYEVKEEDKKRFSPLGYDHITFEGRYSFESEAYGNNDFRPLRPI